ncbi:MAG: sigma-70 family RNA polymerase sigma factor [Gemmataceae bacterium]
MNDDTDSDAPPPDPARHAEFLKLFTRYQREIYAYVFALVRDWHAADEVMQETSLALWAHFGRFRPDGNFPAWACKVAYHRVLRDRRKRGRDRHAFGEEFEAVLIDAADRSTHHEARRDALNGCLEKLPHRDRTLIEACYAGEGTIREAASRLNLSAKVVYKAAARIREALADCVNRTLSAEGRR